MKRFILRALLKLLGLNDSIIPIKKKGLVIILIDSLSYQTLLKAMRMKKMRFLNKLIKKEDYSILPYFCGLPATTTATESELFYGNSDNIPSYAWYDRKLKHYVRGSTGIQMKDFEEQIQNTGKPLLKDGSCILGAYSGGAELLDYAAKELRFDNPIHVLSKLRPLILPFFNPFRFTFLLYLLSKSFLLNLLVVMRRLPMKTLKRSLKEDASKLFLGDLTEYFGEVELLRKTPALFINFTHYDYFAHTYGPHKKICYSALKLIDWYCKSLYNAMTKSKRDYNFIILSDHGQVESHVFTERYSISLEHWFAKILQSRERNVINNQGNFPQSRWQLGKDIFLTASGSMLHIYMSESLENPLTHQDIELKFPQLIKRLMSEEAIGWLLVRKTVDSSILLGKDGSIQFSRGKIHAIYGKPFSNLTIQYEKKVLESLTHYSTYSNNGDLVLFGNVITGKVVAFENQRGTHGGFYNSMIEPFILTNNTKLVNQLKKNNDMKKAFEILRNLRQY